MPKQIKISKDDILRAALEIVRNDGIEKVSNREIAKKLNCSIRPIYYQFENSEELLNELNKKMIKYFYDFITNNMNDEMPKYKQTGINYIKFAKEEKYINISTSLTGENLKSFHVKMWLFTHGLATLIACKAVNLTDEEISELLSSEFRALVLLEDKK